MGWLYHAWRSQTWSDFWLQGRRKKFQNPEHLALCRLPKVLQLKICQFQPFSFPLSWLLATLESLSPQTGSWGFHWGCFAFAAVVGLLSDPALFWAILGPAQKLVWHRTFEFSVVCNQVLTFCCLSTFRLREAGYRKWWSSLNKSSIWYFPPGSY